MKIMSRVDALGYTNRGCTLKTRRWRPKMGAYTDRYEGHNCCWVQELATIQRPLTEFILFLFGKVTSDHSSMPTQMRVKTVIKQKKLLYYPTRGYTTKRFVSTHSHNKPTDPTKYRYPSSKSTLRNARSDIVCHLLLPQDRDSIHK